jgi:hypothetical protein
VLRAPTAPSPSGGCCACTPTAAHAAQVEAPTLHQFNLTTRASCRQAAEAATQGRTGCVYTYTPAGHCCSSNSRACTTCTAAPEVHAQARRARSQCQAPQMERATLRNPVCITLLPAVLASYATTQRLLSPQRKANPPGVLLAAGTPATCRTMLPATPCGCCLMHPDAARLPAHRPAAMPAAGMQQCMQQADSQHSQPQREPAACRHPTHWSTSKACDDPAPPAQLCNPCHTAHQRRTCHMHAL